LFRFERTIGPRRNLKTQPQRSQEGAKHLVSSFLSIELIRDHRSWAGSKLASSNKPCRLDRVTIPIIEDPLSIGKILSGLRMVCVILSARNFSLPVGKTSDVRSSHYIQHDFLTQRRPNASVCDSLPSPWGRVVNLHPQGISRAGVEHKSRPVGSGYDP
jgi:hypothetical protein